MISAATCLAIAVFCASIFFWLRFKGHLTALELRAYDWWINQAEPDSRFSDGIVLIGLTEEDIRALKIEGAETPLRDDTLLRLIDRVREMQPRAIGVDFIRDQKRGPLQDQTFDARALTRRLTKQGGARIKMAFRLVPDEADSTGARMMALDYYPGYKDSGVMGYDRRLLVIGSIDLTADAADGIVRRGIVTITHPGEWVADGIDVAASTTTQPATKAKYCSLPALLAAEYIAKLSEASPQPDPAEPAKNLPALRAIDVVTSIIATPPGEIWKGVDAAFAWWPSFDANFGGYVDEELMGSEFLLDFRGGGAGRRFKTFTVQQLLGQGTMPAVTAADLAGKIVILGQTAGSVEDNVTSPLQVKHEGLQILAHTTDQLVRAWWSGTRPLQGVSEWMETARLFGWTLLGALLGIFVRGPWKFCAGLILILAAIYFSTFIGFRWGYWLASVAPAMSFFTCATLTTSYMAYREKVTSDLTRKVFDRHVDQKVVAKMLQDPDNIPQNETIIAAVLFTDLVGFGKASEKFTAEELMRWLNEYMNPMSQVVLDNYGMINKYMGDAIMAMFGVPIPSTGGIAADARNAVRCALQMRRTLITLNATWRETGQPEAKMRLGIMTGELVAGMLGSARRVEYTVIGDVVNKAARLEQCAKELMSDEICIDGCRIFVGEPVFQLLRDEFWFEEMPPVEFKPGERPVKVFSVVSDSAAVEREQRSALKLPPPVAVPQREAARTIMDDDEEEIATDLGRLG